MNDAEPLQSVHRFGRLLRQIAQRLGRTANRADPDFAARSQLLNLQGL